MEIETDRYGSSGNGIITTRFRAENWEDAGYDDWAKVYNAIQGISSYDHGNEHRVAMTGAYMGLRLSADMYASHIKDGHIHMRIKIGCVENDFHVPRASAMNMNARRNGIRHVTLGTTTLDVYLPDVYPMDGIGVHTSGTKIDNMVLFSSNWIRGELPRRGAD